MSRTETANRLTVSAVDKKVDAWSDHLAHLQTMQAELGTMLESLALQRVGTADDMARALLPVAESMARLTEETRQTLTLVVTRSRQGHQEATNAIAASTRAAQEVSSDLRTTMLRTEEQMRGLQSLLQDAQNSPPSSPWPPAIVAALIPLAAVLWLAWKLGAIRL